MRLFALGEMPKKKGGKKKIPAKQAAPAPAPAPEPEPAAAVGA